MKNQKGFTLLELLISITLIAILVVILSMALRSGINAYTRSKTFNRHFLPSNAIYGLLWRQLEAVPRPSDRNISSYSKFFGKKDALSFVTMYVPQGTAAGGLFQVAYLFDSSKERIVYLQKALTSYFDIEKDILTSLFRLDLDDIAEEGWLADRVNDVEDFSLSYEPSRGGLDTGPDDWDEKFEKGRLPREIAFRIRFKGQDEQQVSWQVIPVGIQ